MRGTPYVMRRRILLSPLGLPCTPPPFGTLVAISLLTGKTIWEVPLGTTRDLVASKIFLPITVGSGTPNLGGPIITAGGLDLHRRRHGQLPARLRHRDPAASSGRAVSPPAARRRR